MVKNQIYQQFAPIYDQFMMHVPYQRWVDYTKAILQKKGRSPKKILDLGCGTGEITIRLAKEGYQLIGVDIATDMLSCANEKSHLNRVDVSWIKQDIRSLSGFSGIDLCISYLDVINYIVELEDIEKVFANVYQALAEDGLFIFDVHHLPYVNDQLIGQTFADVTDELAYIWDCAATEKEGEMYHYLTFFQKQSDHTYKRFDEFHQQRTFPLAAYRQLLKKVGFNKIAFHSDFFHEKEIIDKNSERIFMIAEK